MAITLTSHVDAADGTCANPCTSTTFTIGSVTSGNRVILSLIFCNDAGCATQGTDVSSISGSANLGTFEVDFANSNNVRVANYSAPVIGTGATTITVNMTADAYYLNGKFSQWAGIKLSGAVDKTGSASGTFLDTTNTVTLSSATTESNELIYAYDDSTATLGTPSGYTAIDSGNANVYKIGSAPGSESATWSTSGSNWNAIIVAYKEETAASTVLMGQVLT